MTTSPDLTLALSLLVYNLTVISEISTMLLPAPTKEDDDDEEDNIPLKMWKKKPDGSLLFLLLERTKKRKAKARKR